MDQPKREIRLDPRVPARLRAVVFSASPEHPEIEMTTRDLSGGGMFCASPLTIPIGKPLKIRLDLTTETGSVHPVIVEAIAIRVEGSGPYGVAFHFTEAPERIREQIRGFVIRTLRVSPPA